MAAGCLVVWDAQPPGTLKACTVIALPSHLVSALCRSTQFVTSINNALSQRRSRLVGCTVDVDWLKVWVQLVVKVRDLQYRDEQYRDAHLNCVLLGGIK